MAEASSLPPTPNSLRKKMRRGAGNAPIWFGVFAQLLLVATGLALALAPPAEGFMVIVPLLPNSPATTIGWVQNADALLIQRGPYTGSYIVKGSLGALFLPALSHGALLFNARFSGCAVTDVTDIAGR